MISQTLESLRVKPNTVGPDGSPLFVPGKANVPIPGWEELGPYGEFLEREASGDQEVIDLPCGCGGS